SLPGLQGLDAQSFPAWLAVIKHADLLLSGRFHYAVAAACLGTPAVSFQSNTPKIDSVLEDLGLPGAVPRVPHFWQRLGKPHEVHATVADFEEALQERLARDAGATRTPLLAECCRRAARNYDWSL
ncbi:MAG: polysaccharide pyruvyl transferase family protein, partial [Armatimonadetes bacterium]|nr:polysaccharide pyruvyl transferase family protein [Armatimonadota bacterium]